jgi:mycothiol system anti-sigma-R factor
MKERCRQTLERAYMYLDDEGLGAVERHAIEVHLEECRPCFERVGLEREVTLLVARLRGSSKCPEGLRSRIAAQLEGF